MKTLLFNSPFCKHPPTNFHFKPKLNFRPNSVPLIFYQGWSLPSLNEFTKDFPEFSDLICFTHSEFWRRALGMAIVRSALAVKAAIVP